MKKLIICMILLSAMLLAITGCGNGKKIQGVGSAGDANSAISGSGEIPTPTFGTYESYLKFIKTADVPDNFVTYEMISDFGEFKCFICAPSYGYDEYKYGIIDKESGEVLLSGGLLIQLLPGAFDDTIEKLEKNLVELDSVTTMLAKGMSTLDMCKEALKGFEVEVLDEFPVKYVCGCSKEKIEKLIESMPKEEIEEMIEQDHCAQAECHFCNKKFVFTEDELKEILRKK